MKDNREKEGEERGRYQEYMVSSSKADTLSCDRIGTMRDCDGLKYSRLRKVMVHY